MFLFPFKQELIEFRKDGSDRMTGRRTLQSILVFLLLIAVTPFFTRHVAAVNTTNFLSDPGFENTSSAAWFPLSSLNNGTVNVHSSAWAHNGTRSALLSAINKTLTCPTLECKDSVRAEVEQLTGTTPRLDKLSNANDSFSAWWFVAPSSFPEYSLHFQLQFSDGKIAEYWYGRSDLSNSSITSRVFNLGPIPPAGSWFETRRNLALDIQGLVANPSSTRVTAIWFGAFGGTFNSTPQGETVWLDDAAIDFDVPRSLPVAAFDSNPPQGTAPLTIQFNASASHESSGFAGSIIVFMWEFGDGSPIENSSDPVISHIYANPGTYTVTLTVVDTNSLRSSPSSATIKVDSVYGGSLPLIVAGGVLGLLVAVIVMRRRRRAAKLRRRNRG